MTLAGCGHGRQPQSFHRPARPRREPVHLSWPGCSSSMTAA